MKKKSQPRNKRNSKRVSSPTQAIVKAQQQTQIVSIPEAIEKVLILGDLASLTPQDRVDYYKRVCDSLGLNPLTMPFSYILFKEFDGGTAKLSLYANKSCTEQLRKIHGVSVVPPMRRSRTVDIVTVECDVRDKTGRTDTASGSVPLYKVKDGRRIDFDGKDLCNAEMKCETKAKRRATLSICGLAILDESELDTMHVVGGVTPDGRIYHFQEPDVPQLGSREAAQDVAAKKIAELTEKASQTQKPPETAPVVQDPLSWKKDAEKKADEAAKPPKAKKAPPKPIETKYALTIDWSLDHTKPVLTGDMSVLGGLLPKDVTLIWDGVYSFWKAEAKYIPAIMQIASQNAFLVKEIQPGQSPQGGQSPSRASSTPGAPPPSRGTAATGGSSNAPAVVSCTIERVNTGMAGKNPVKHVTLLLADRTKPCYSCFDKKWFEALDAGLGKTAELITKQNGKYTNIIGARKIGSKEWDEDGVPIIQNRDREAGGKTLF